MGTTVYIHEGSSRPEERLDALPGVDKFNDDLGGQIVAGPMNNPDAPPVPAGLVATDEGVREMKLRWMRYSTFGEASPKTSRSEELLAEIQAQWRQYRGVDEKTGNMFRRDELRPELQKMC